MQTCTINAIITYTDDQPKTITKTVKKTEIKPSIEKTEDKPQLKEPLKQDMIEISAKKPEPKCEGDACKCTGDNCKK